MKDQVIIELLRQIVQELQIANDHLKHISPVKPLTPEIREQLDRLRDH